MAIAAHHRPLRGAGVADVRQAPARLAAAGLNVPAAEIAAWRETPRPDGDGRRSCVRPGAVGRQALAERLLRRTQRAGCWRTVAMSWVLGGPNEKPLAREIVGDTRARDLTGNDLATPSWRLPPLRQRSPTIPASCMSPPRSARRRSESSARPDRGTVAPLNPLAAAMEINGEPALPAMPSNCYAGSAITAACATSAPTGCSRPPARACGASISRAFTAKLRYNGVFIKSAYGVGSLGKRTLRMTVLVTGGAGYIGSHMVLELADAGEPVVVLDNLSTGFDWAIAEGAPLIVGDSGDQALVASLIRQHHVDAIIHFAASVVVPEFGPRSARLLSQQHGQHPRADRMRGEQRRAPFHLFFDCRRIRQSGEIPVKETTPTQPISPYGWSKLMSEIMLRDAGRAHGLRYVILRYFNVAGADPRGRGGQSSKDATHLIKVAVETALGAAPQAANFRHRLPDAGRHLHARLHSRQRSRARAFGCASPLAFRRAVARRSIAATVTASRCSK